MTEPAFIKDIENFFHIAVDDTVTALAPAIAYLKANGGAVALSLGETLLTTVEAGTSWAALVAQFIPIAEKAGIALAENAASAVLNAAQTNLAGKGVVIAAAPSPAPAA
jgi:hypothetical protein